MRKEKKRKEKERKKGRGKYAVKKNWRREKTATIDGLNSMNLQHDEAWAWETQDAGSHKARKDHPIDVHRAYR